MNIGIELLWFRVCIEDEVRWEIDYWWGSEEEIGIKDSSRERESVENECRQALGIKIIIYFRSIWD